MPAYLAGALGPTVLVGVLKLKRGIIREIDEEAQKWVIERKK
jgi:hypothetical protein